MFALLFLVGMADTVVATPTTIPPARVPASTLPVVWSTTGGTITQDGRYEAPKVAGRYLVIMRQGRWADTGTVTVTAATQRTGIPLERAVEICAVLDIAWKPDACHALLRRLKALRQADRRPVGFDPSLLRLVGLGLAITGMVILTAALPRLTEPSTR